MMDGAGISKAIRMKKKNQLRPDMDYAGQDAVDPNEALDIEKNQEVSDALGEPDHEPASPAEMGENESSQDIAQLKKSVARLEKYFDSLMIED
jgi:hypothetical protein